MTLRWYDYLLKGIANGMESEKPVRIFVMGKNVWRDEDDWPLARARQTRFYLHSNGKANGLTGDGNLSESGAGGKAADNSSTTPGMPYLQRAGHSVATRCTSCRSSRSEACGSSSRRAGVHHSSLEARHRGYRTSQPGTLRQLRLPIPTSLANWWMSGPTASPRISPKAFCGALS